MRQFTICAAVALAAALASVPAQAERNWGPLQQNGQCWNQQVATGGTNAGTWGYWSACPQKASAVVTTKRPRHHRASR